LTLRPARMVGSIAMDVEPVTESFAKTSPFESLTRFERVSVQAMDILLRRARPLTEAWLRRVSANWMTLGSRRMMHVRGLERLEHLTFQDGILLVANHRSFFDLYMLTLLLHRHTPLRQPVLCPVRSDFFYTSVPGVMVNVLVGGGRMFPPFFRDQAKQSFNRWALERVVNELRSGCIVVGFHPEGTRNKNLDPYRPLPAQPGVGKLIMETWPIVVPAFINGLSNDILADLRGNFSGRKRVVAVFGEPVDLARFRSLGNRLSSHKRIADSLLQVIYGPLASEERAFRAELEGRGEARGTPSAVSEQFKSVLAASE
jgi:1-acyl-sn-glycerol-3-phosphate acyltransferase